MVFSLLAANPVFADRDGKDGKDGGNRGSSGDSRSFSGGNQSSRGSSDSNRGRTFSRDSDSNRSNRSSDKIFVPKPDQSQSKQGTQYQVRRPTDNDGRDVLKFTPNNNFKRYTDRNPKDRALVDKEFNTWRNTWNGQKGDGRDNRDWTGSWKNSDRFTNADRIRGDWRGRRQNDLVFGGDWWRDKHRGNYWDFWGDYSRRYNRPWYWWSWANGPRLGSWIVFGWPTPYYWDYGPGEYIAYDNGAMYVNGRWYEPSQVYYDQTVRMIDQRPLSAEAAARMEWMPLGVFAVTPDGLAEPMANVQLAVTKDGIIGGTAFDQRSGAAFTVQGTVDQRTQRAAWSYTNDQNRRVVMETSMYNLTQPEATGLVHYGPNDMRVVELVRLPEPSSGSAPPQTAAPGSLPPPAVQK
jgi:hypothetical protein